MATQRFEHLPTYPIQPLLLARDVSLEAGMQALVAVGREIDYEVEIPQRSEIAKRGKATLGLSLTEPRRLQAALRGTYAETEWGDLREALSERWGSELIDLLFSSELEDGVDVSAVQSQVFTLLAFRADGEGDLGARGLRFLWRAWNLRRQVIGGRPLSLWPAVGGDVLTDVHTFTPVLKAVGEGYWQVGWEGDARPDSPVTFAAEDGAAALERAWQIWVAWYQEENDAATDHLKEQARRQYLSPGHLTHGAYEQALAREGRLGCGDIVVTNISHAQLFNLHTVRRGDLLFRTDRRTAAAVAVLACAEYELVLPAPAAAEVTEAYLSMWAGQDVALETLPEMDIRPVELAPDQMVAYRVATDGERAEVAIFREIARLAGKPVIGAVILNGQRAFIVPDQGAVSAHALERQGLARREWGRVSIEGVDLQQVAWKQALGAWAIYVAARRA
jgi:hypothetical protein